jgi:hypothetical protein
VSVFLGSREMTEGTEGMDRESLMEREGRGRGIRIIHCIHTTRVRRRKPASFPSAAAFTSSSPEGGRRESYRSSERSPYEREPSWRRKSAGGSSAREV